MSNNKDNIVYFASGRFSSMEKLLCWVDALNESALEHYQKIDDSYYSDYELSSTGIEYKLQYYVFKGQHLRGVNKPNDQKSKEDHRREEKKRKKGDKGYEDK